MSQTVVFITGVGRGIGHGLLSAYLQRPNHTVIGSVRDATSPSTQALLSLPTATGSSLHLVSIESSSETDPRAAVTALAAKGITHLDLVIANAGVSPDLAPFDRVSVHDLRLTWEVNALGLVLLYQALKPLLDKAAHPKWISITSGAGSIQGHQDHNLSAVAAYGMSKAAANFFTASVHISNERYIAYAVHPGLVQTDMGTRGAIEFGLAEAPVTLADAVNKTMTSIDTAKREVQGGKLWDTIEDKAMPY